MHLPPPSVLRRKIIIKNKKKHHKKSVASGKVTTGNGDLPNAPIRQSSKDSGQEDDDNGIISILLFT